MSTSIGKVLGDPRFNEPPEVEIIKEFIREQFKADCAVMIQERQIAISVRSAALAGALRMHLHTLSAMCQTKKRLIIRITG